MENCRICLLVDDGLFWLFLLASGDMIGFFQRRLDEFGLWQQLQADAKELENVYPRSEPPVLADVLRLYGDAIGVILEERVLTDLLVEKRFVMHFFLQAIVDDGTLHICTRLMYLTSTWKAQSTYVTVQWEIKSVKVSYNMGKT